LLTDGTPDQVASRLSELIAPFGLVRPNDKWMPQGFEDLEEAELPDAHRLVAEDIRLNLQSWWLALRIPGARTPNWDVASTCTIGGKAGLLLVEAKAHDAELITEVKGRVLEREPSNDSRRNHNRIGAAIEEANFALNAVAPGWSLSRDSHYQMVNRFSWSWKLTELGIPVILVYLGFLNATEMKDRGNIFGGSVDWEELVLTHSKGLVPAHTWNRQLIINGQPFIPLIRSLTLPLTNAEQI
jgi:hypothetical protein